MMGHSVSAAGSQSIPAGEVVTPLGLPKSSAPARAGVQPGWFPAVDSLRGFAALTVLVYHVIEHTQWSEFPTAGPLAWFRMGWSGVDMFFVISGFVITYSASHPYFASGTFRRFYFIHRLARIVPLYLLTGVVYVAILDPSAVDRQGW